MAASPQWKIYRNKEYIGCCKYAEDAAALVAMAGGLVKHGHSLVVWTEGQEDFSAGESYDGAGAIMQDRVDSARAASAHARGL
ncbi:MAG: hypothetical protein V4720_06275 [Pseudomonadota bacterium]